MIDHTLPRTATNTPGNDNDVTAILWPDIASTYVNNKAMRLCSSNSVETAYPYSLNETAFSGLTGLDPLSVRTLARSLRYARRHDLLDEVGAADDFTTPRRNAYKLTAPADDLNDVADARPTARHFERANITFMDGHTKAVRLEQFYRDQMPPDRYFPPSLS